MAADETPAVTDASESERLVTGLTPTRRPVRIAGLVIAAAVIALLNGAVGLAIGGAVIAVGLVTAAPVAFGAGVAGLLISPEIDPVLHAVGALALLAVLVDPAVGAPTGRRVLVATVGVSVVIGAGTYSLLTVWSLPAVTVGLALSVALIMYAIHRYERVTLGLVSDPPNQ